MKQVSLLIATNSQGQILLQHKTANAPNFAGMWCLFGGQVEMGESADQALIREIDEELGIKLGLNDFKSIGANDHDGVQRNFFVAVIDEDIKILRRNLMEGDDVQYFDLKEIKALNIAPPHLIGLMAFIGQQPVR